MKDDVASLLEGEGVRVREVGVARGVIPSPLLGRRLGWRGEACLGTRKGEEGAMRGYEG
jgi:hypothetical protein